MNRFGIDEEVEITDCPCDTCEEALTDDVGYLSEEDLELLTVTYGPSESYLADGVSMHIEGLED
jgi:hypothetical protein